MNNLAVPLQNQTDASQKPVLLFVDDSVESLNLMRRMFEGSNYHCLFADKPEVALTIITQQQIDVIVSDIRMPGMTGIELLERVKVESPDTIRIAMTGTIDFTDAVGSINRSAVTHYIMKPADSKTLKLSIYQELKKRERNRLELERIQQSRKCANDRVREMWQGREDYKVMALGFQALATELTSTMLPDESTRKVLRNELLFAEALLAKSNLKQRHKMNISTALALSHLSPPLISGMKATSVLDPSLLISLGSSSGEQDIEADDILARDYCVLIKEAIKEFKVKDCWEEVKLSLCNSQAHLSYEVLESLLEVSDFEPIEQ